MSPDHGILLVALLAGLVSASYGAAVGGGALVTVPALIFAGLEPVAAIATSRLGSLGVACSGIYAFGRSGEIDWRLGRTMAALQSLGALLGASLLLQVPTYWVGKAIGVMILAVLILLLVFPSVGIQPQAISSRSLRFKSGFFFTFLLGILSGFYQGGGGTLAAYIMILFFGQTFLQSAGTRKIPVLITNLIAIAVFLPHDLIHFPAGIALGVGTPRQEAILAASSHSPKATAGCAHSLCP